MKRLLFTLLLFFGYGFSQTNCELCVEQNGFYCGDDTENWTQYSPNGCVPNGLNDLFYLNDGWLDCVDGSDEAEAVPTTLEDCSPYIEPCDTIYVNTIDTVFIDVFIEVPEYIDCDTGLPCGQIGLQELIKESEGNNKIYNLQGKEIIKPEGVYIKNGKIMFNLKK